MSFQLYRVDLRAGEVAGCAEGILGGEGGGVGRVERNAGDRVGEIGVVIFGRTEPEDLGHFPVEISSRRLAFSL